MTPNCRTLPTPLSPWAVALFATALMHPLAASSSENPGHRLVDVVWISPICGGPQREGDLCRAPLAGAEVRLSEDGGRVAASAKTDATGAFAMRAPAGRYRLHVAGVVKVTRCPDLAVTLPMATPGPVELQCDSAMR